MKLEIQKNVFDKFDAGFNIRALFCTLNNTGDSAQVNEMLRDVEELVRVNFTVQKVQNHGMISAFRSAFEHYHDKFRHYESNVEALLLDILNGTEIKRSNKLSDLTTFISLKYLLPVTVIDLLKVSGNLRFCVASGREVIRNRNKAHFVHKGDLCLKDNKGVLERKLGFNLSSRASVTKTTKKALILFEYLMPLSHQKIVNVSSELASLLKIFCGARTVSYDLNKSSKVINVKQ